MSKNRREELTLNEDNARLLRKLGGTSVNRRSLIQRGAALGLGSAALAAGAGSLLGFQGAQARRRQDSPDSGVKGGKLRVAIIGEPPTLDEHTTTAEVTAIVSYCMFEGLFTYDADYKPIPELVDTYTVSEDGLTHTMKLRADVPFHNGEILKTDDAVASIQRWGQISGVGKRLLEATASIDKVDDLTFDWKLTRPYGTLTVALAHNTQA
jgi:peptide/nickel transport system substrate-binding protein